jgi:hypothetical protein
MVTIYIKLTWCAFKFYICRVNFKTFITALSVILLLFVIEAQEGDVPSHELRINGFDAISSEQGDVIISQIKQDLSKAGASYINVQSLQNGSLLISYQSNLNKSLVLELFSVPSSGQFENKSVNDLLVHAHLDLHIKDAGNQHTIPSGCNGVLNYEFKTDIDRQATQRLIALPYNFTSITKTVKASTVSVKHFSCRIVVTNSHVYIPDSRAGPLS